MADVYTSMFPMVCGIEVKDSGGDYIEAVTQLGIWSAACLAKMAQLQQQSVERGSQQKTSIPPIIGWTVIGHEWKLHICWKDETGTVVRDSFAIYRTSYNANLSGDCFGTNQQLDCRNRDVHGIICIIRITEEGSSVVVH